MGELNLEKTISVGRKRQFKLQLQAAADLIGLGHYSWNPQTNELTWDPVLTGIWALPPGIKPDFKIWLDGIHPHDVAQVLDTEGVCIRAGHHCTKPLHRRLGLGASARASFYVYTTQDEIDILSRALHKTRDLFRVAG